MQHHFKIFQLFQVSLHEIEINKFEPWNEISNNMVCETSKGSDQPAHKSSLIRAFASPLNSL